MGRTLQAEGPGEPNRRQGQPVMWQAERASWSAPAPPAILPDSRAGACVVLTGRGEDGPQGGEQRSGML